MSQEAKLRETRSTKSLWGELPDVSAIVAPITILKQQGSLLARATKGMLTASAIVNQGNLGRLKVTMYLVATALNNYRYEVLSVSHGVEPYPAQVTAEGQNIQCPDRDAFEKAVEQVLQSERVRKAIAGLLAQMQAN
jgi:hypothetical protein